MLRMTLELLPYGSEKDRKTLKVIEIGNTMTHANPYKFGNYKARFKNSLPKDTPWRYNYVTDYPREQYDALYLLYLVLRKFIHEYQQPIDKRAKQDQDDASGPGHRLLPGVSSGVGQYGKRDSSRSGNPNYFKKRVRAVKRDAVSIWEQELQKNDLPGV
ncbi:MAG TPA: hypothetical protein VFM18_06385 [Methanosarcina sp.]|nr:hypothetical protein [Methanosarcina sp.]